MPTLDPVTIDCRNIMVSGDEMPMAVTTYPLSNPASIDGNDVTCNIGATLQIIIKTTGNFGVAAMDTYAHFQAGNGIRNTAGMEFTSTMGVRSTDHEEDMSAPQLMSFVEFDLDQGALSFSFNEVVNVSSLNFTDLTLQDDFGISTASVTLSGGLCDSSVNCTIGDVFSFNLLTEDLNRIKLNPGLCTSTTNCVPTYSGAFIVDLYGNAIMPYDPRLQGRHTLEEFISDTTSPRLVGFDLDLSEDILLLAFDEPVSSSSFEPGGFSLQDLSAGGGETVMLTSSSTVDPGDGERLTINLNADANTIKLSSGVATSENTTFLVISATAVDDLYTNDVEAIESSNAQQVRNYTADTTPPSVSSVVLNLDSNHLVVTFDEPVTNASIVARNFTLSNGTASNAFQLGDSQILDANSNPLVGDALVVEFTLSNSVLTALKTDPNIGTDSSNTFLEWNEESFEDTSGNANVGAADVAVSNVIQDATAATLIDFSIDLNSGSIVLTFNDVIDVSTASLNRRTITIQDRRDSSLFFDLTGGVVQEDDSTTVAVNITDVDLRGLKATLGIATSASTTFITIEAEAFEDLQGTPIIAVTSRNAIPVSSYIADITPPMLLSFDFDLNGGRIVMTFDEPINEESFVYNRITVQENPNATARGISLQSGTIATAASRTIATLTLTRADLNLIKADVDIASEMTNTYLMLDDGAVNDTSSNPVASTAEGAVAAIDVTIFTPDTTAPEIERFVLDLNDGILRVTFSETINVTTFTNTLITLRSTSSVGGQELDISGGTSGGESGCCWWTDSSC